MINKCKIIARYSTPLALLGVVELLGMQKAGTAPPPILPPLTNICITFPALCSGGAIIPTVPKPKGPYTVFTVPLCRIQDTRSPQ